MENINHISNSTNTDNFKGKTKRQLVKQLILIRKNYKKKYYQSHFYKIKDSPILSQDDSVIVCEGTKGLHHQDGQNLY